MDDKTTMLTGKFDLDFDTLQSSASENGEVIYSFRNKHTNTIEKITLNKSEVQTLTISQIRERLYHRHGKLAQALEEGLKSKKIQLNFKDNKGYEYGFKSVVFIEFEDNKLENLYTVFVVLRRSEKSFDYEKIHFFSSKNELEALNVKSSLETLIDLLS